MQKLILAGFLAYIVFLLWQDHRRRKGVSWTVWMVTIWAAMIGSRPVTTWFSFGGEQSYDEGSGAERMVYFVLIAVAGVQLMRRKLSFGEVLRSNQWLAVFFFFWLMSVFWSEAPFVSLKRWVKDVGNILMILVLLTEDEPLEAIKAVFTRCAFVLIPMSVVLIKYYGDLGRMYHIWSGEMMYTGVTTHKNMLGALVMVCGLVYMWDFIGRIRAGGKQWRWKKVVVELPVVLMSLYLLHMAGSATALGCAVIGAAIYFGLAIPTIQRKAKHLEVYVMVGGLTVWLLDAIFDLKRLIVVDLLGRDLTLTTRTEVWPMLLKKSDGFLLGSGFNSFWSGERLQYFLEKFGILQAHNGYLETYLNGGMVAVVLLLVYLFAANLSIRRNLVGGDEFARVRMMFLVVAVIYNFTEAAFNKMGLVWLALLVVTVELPRWQARAARRRQLREDEKRARARGMVPEAQTWACQ